MTPRSIEEYPQAADLPTPPAPPPVDAKTDASVRPPPGEVATLAFLGDAACVSVKLVFPFEWEGRTVSEIKVRRLSMLAIARAFPDFAARDDWELYAVMTDHSAPVLRGLLREDREAVARAADAFLSQEGEEAPSAPTRANGDASRSLPAAP